MADDDDVDSFRSLWSAVTKALAHSEDDEAVRRAEVLLARHRPSFLSLLENAPQHPNDKRQVESGEVVVNGVRRRLDKSMVADALALADTLKISELSAASLVVEAEVRRQRYGSDRMRTALHLHHHERWYVLSSLLLVIKGSIDEALPQSLQALLSAYADALLKERIVAKILHHLGAIKPASLPEASQGYARDELRLLAQCLFYICYRFPVKDADVRQMVYLVKRPDVFENVASSGSGASASGPSFAAASGAAGAPSSSLAGARNGGKQGTNGTATLAPFNPVQSTVLLALLAALQAAVSEDPSTGDSLAHETAFVSAFTQEIRSQWECAPALAIVKLAWALFLSNGGGIDADAQQGDDPAADKYVLEAIRGDCFAALAGCVLTSDPLAKGEDDRDFFLVVIDGLIRGTIERAGIRLRELKLAEEREARDRAYQPASAAASPAPQTHGFRDLLVVLAGVYADQPLLAERYWNRQENLYPFLRMASECHTPAHLVAFIDVLAALSCERDLASLCYSFLTERGGSASQLVSMEHFLNVIDRYQSELRAAVTPADMAYGGVRRPGVAPQPKEIRPEEAAGLGAIMRLIARLVGESPTVRTTLHQAFSGRERSVQHPLFALLGCPVPPSLKGEILEVLAAFARAPELASQLWALLDKSQIVPGPETAPMGIAAAGLAGIRYELEEIESRYERYPETLAFLSLLDALTRHGLPANFAPYLSFLRDSVFLKFDSRAYAVPAERWRVASGAVGIFLRVLWRYDPDADPAFAQATVLGSDQPQEPEPGHEVLAGLLSGGPMLRKVLSVIDHASEALAAQMQVATREVSAREQYRAFEDATLACLRLLVAGLAQQGRFLELQRTRHATVMATRLERLLLGVNPRTGEADHMLQVSLLVSHHARPSICLAACRIVAHLVHDSDAQSRLARVLVGAPDATAIASGFIERLDIDQSEDVEEDLAVSSLAEEGAEAADQNGGATASVIRKTILRMLLDCMGEPYPNVALFLLGFQPETAAAAPGNQLQRELARAAMQFGAPASSRLTLGAVGTGTGCFRVIVELLCRGIGRFRPPTLATDAPHLAELSYQLVHALCADPRTSGAAMRYLRNTEDFFFRQVYGLPVRIPSSDAVDGNPVLRAHLLNQRAWVLKAAALELRIMHATGQRSHTLRLLHVMFGTPVPMHLLSPGDAAMADPSAAGAFPQYEQQGPEQPRMRMLELLDGIDLDYAEPTRPQTGALDAAEIERCEFVDARGVPLVDIGTLHGRLVAACASVELQDRDTAEIDAANILNYAAARNEARADLQARHHSLEGWTQAVRVALVGALDTIPATSRQPVVVAITQELLPRAAADAPPVVALLVTECLASVVYRLRYELMQAVSAAGGGGQSAAPAIPFEQLRIVVQGAVEAVLRAGTTQPVRGNLHATLLNALSLVHPGGQQRGDRWTPGITPPSAALTQAALASYGARLVESVSRDACDGADLWRMVSLSTLDALITGDASGSVLGAINKRGYVRHIAEDPAREDARLQATVLPGPESLNVLFVYESEMALLLRVAENPGGAAALVESGVLRRLCDCNFVAQRPDDAPFEVGTFVPPSLERYHQLLLPLLRLLVGVVEATGGRHVGAVGQAAYFIVQHSDLVASVLRDRVPTLTPTVVEELWLTVALLRHASSNSDALTHLGTARAQRLRGLCLALLQRYCTRDRWANRAHEVGSELERGVRMLLANVAGYLRVEVDGNAPEVDNAGSPRILFSPSLAVSKGEVVDTTGGARVAPPLATLAVLLRSATLAFQLATDKHRTAVQQTEHFDELSPAQLRDIATGAQGMGEDPSAADDVIALSAIARGQLAAAASEAEAEIADLICIRRAFHTIENCLYVLWRHLDHFLSKTAPAPLSYASRVPLGLDVAQHAPDVVQPLTTQESEALRLDGNAHLSEVLGRLYDTKQLQLPSRRGTGLEFVHAIVRRIRAMLALRTA